jgi:hypothetical protein
MHQRKCDAKTKALIVSQDLQGKPGAVICNADQTSQSLYNRGVAEFC